MIDLIKRLRSEAEISDRPGQFDRLNALAHEFAAALDAARAERDALAAAMSQAPAAGEEIMVNAAHDVYTLPLQPSGLSSGPRFVVHVPAPEQQPEARGVVDGCHCATCTCHPGMTPAIRFNTSLAAQEGAIRDHLIALGWTPPGAQRPAAEGANVAHATAALQAEIEALRAEVERLTLEMGCLQQQYDERTACMIVHRGSALACSDAVRTAYYDERRRADNLRAEVVKLGNLRADAIHECALANIHAERMAEALEEIRSRSSINLAMQPDPFELTARLGDIYQIADAALAREGGQ